MKWVSELLLPVSRGKQGKIRDRGLARLVQGGYALWNPNDQTVIQLPAGKKLYDRAAEYLLKALEGFAPQAIDVCGSSRGSLDAAVRLVRRAGDLPLLLAQRSGDRLELLGLHADAEAAMDMCADALRTLGSAMCAFDLRLRQTDRLTDDGYAIDLFCRDESPLRGDEGFACPDCGWLACADTPCRRDVPACEDAEKPLECVPTPGCSTIEDLCALFGIGPEQTVKCMFYAAEGRGLIAVILRGDRQVSLEKLRAALRGLPVRPAEPGELAAVMGDSAGYMGPIGLPSAVTLLADRSVAGIRNAVAGANKAGFHYTGACWGRDFETKNVLDLTLVQEGECCPLCSAPLKAAELRRLARFRPVDPSCASEMSLTFFNGQSKLHVPAWSASIDLTAFISAVAEANASLPEELAPFHAWLWWDGEEPPFELAPLVEAIERSGRAVIACDRPGKADDRAAEAAALMAPQSIFCTLRDGSPCVTVTENGQTRETTLDEFIASPANAAL